MLSAKRLRKEYSNLQKDPVPLAIAKPLENNILEWHFLIRGLADSDFEGGLYHGVLKFPPEYPLKPPAIMFYTPSGRFAINTRVCLSISDFHPETWTPSWTVGTILTGIVSFFNGAENTTGAVEASSDERMRLALVSSEYNSKNKIFVSLFGEDPGKLIICPDDTKKAAT